jgi:hypothetical protein
MSAAPKQKIKKKSKTAPAEPDTTGLGVMQQAQLSHTEYARIGKVLAEALFTKIGKAKFGMVSTPKKAGGKASVFRSPTGKEGEEKVLTTSGKEVKTSTKRADQWEKAAKKREGEKD